jgi:tRNA-specific 2-thiouridylase
VLPRRRRLPRFLERRGLEPREGAIVDEDGRELGRHAGHWRFTPGQRRASASRAAAALRAALGRATNTVVVGPRTSLARTTSSAAAGCTSRSSGPTSKLRYRSEPSRARRGDRRGFRLELDEPSYGVAPGQAAVLYDGDVVVGAGTIRERLTWQRNLARRSPLYLGVGLEGHVER